MKNNTILARELRKNQTPQEYKFWILVRNKKYKNLAFRRQYPIGPYIVDFVCKEKWLIVELDGGQHNEEENAEYDDVRTKYLSDRGYRVLRFWNNEVDNNIEGVFGVIDSFLEGK